MCREFENTVRNTGCQSGLCSLSAYCLGTVQVRIKPNANTSTDRHKASATANEGTFYILSPVDIDPDSNGRGGKSIDLGSGDHRGFAVTRSRCDQSLRAMERDVQHQAEPAYLLELKFGSEMRELGGEC